MPRPTTLHRALHDMRNLSMALLGQHRFASPRGTVLRRLARMVRAGLVAGDGRRRYTLTDEGRRRAVRAAGRLM